MILQPLRMQSLAECLRVAVTFLLQTGVAEYCAHVVQCPLTSTGPGVLCKLSCMHVPVVHP